MPRRPREPHWLNRTIVDSFHNDQLKAHGGLHGLRGENALEAALARPRNKWAYDKETDLAVLAAAYGFAITASHPYLDGNKRTGFLAIVTFLGINGYDFRATDVQVVTEILGLAAGQVTEKDLAHWVRTHMKRV